MENVEIEGIDRLVIGVKDMDRALSFFSAVMGVKFVELKGLAPDMSGCRVAISLDKRLELISPVAEKLPDMNPPDPIGLARRLEQQGDGLLYALVLRVKDLDQAVANAERHGVRLTGNRVEFPRDEQLGLRDIKEVVFNEEDTFGIKMAFAEYQKDP